MGGIFSYESKAMAWQDSAALQNPQRRVMDWHRFQTGISFSLASSRILTVNPNETVTLPITSAAAVPGALSFSVAANTARVNTYRFSKVAEAPDLVTENILTADTDVEVTVRSDGYISVVLSAANLTAVPGGRVFISGTSTGDAAGPFSAANEGNWRVVSASSDGLSFVLAPLNGQSGVSESVAAATGTAVRAYPVGPDVGWWMYGRQGDWYGVFEVVGLTADWVELKRASLPAAVPVSLPQQIGGSAAWYWAASWPKFVRIESDGVVEITGLVAGGMPYSIIPFSVGNSEQMGWIEMAGGSVAPTPASVTNGGYTPVQVNLFVVY